MAEVVLHLYIAGNGQGGAVGDADSTHVAGISGHAVGVGLAADAAVFIPVVLYYGTFTQVDRGAGT